MRYEIIGDTMPAVEITFDAPGESMYTQSGGMAWMTEGVAMARHSPDPEYRRVCGTYRTVYSVGEQQVVSAGSHKQRGQNMSGRLLTKSGIWRKIEHTARKRISRRTYMQRGDHLVRDPMSLEAEPVLELPHENAA